MVGWLLYRLMGSGVLLFVFAYVIGTALIGWRSSAYNDAIHLDRMTGIRIGEILLVGSVLYHALSGIWIPILDFWQHTTVVQKKLYNAVLTLSIALYLPSVLIVMERMLLNRCRLHVEN
jgi:succinate dehydrogenase / fumarate reductase, cytochrome b subunit